MGIIWLELTLPETKISCTCVFVVAFATFFTKWDSAPIGGKIIEAFLKKNRHGGLLQSFHQSQREIL